jgi:hypothetical protein
MPIGDRGGVLANGEPKADHPPNCASVHLRCRTLDSICIRSMTPSTSCLRGAATAETRATSAPASSSRFSASPTVAWTGTNTKVGGRAGMTSPTGRSPDGGQDRQPDERMLDNQPESDRHGAGDQAREHRQQRQAHEGVRDRQPPPKGCLTRLPPPSQSSWHVGSLPSACYRHPNHRSVSSSRSATQA